MIANSHAAQSASEDVAIGPVVVAQQRRRCRVPRKRLDDLARNPLRRWIGCDSDVHDETAFVAQDDKGEQPLETDRGWPGTCAVKLNSHLPTILKFALKRYAPSSFDGCGVIVLVMPSMPSGAMSRRVAVMTASLTRVPGDEFMRRTSTTTS